MNVIFTLHPLAILVFLISFFGCNSNKIVEEFYENGDLKTSFLTQQGLINGEYKSYYMGNFLKEVHIYYQDEKIDSSIFYYPPPLKNRIKQIRYWKDSTNLCVNYEIDGKIISKGESHNSEINSRIGNWIFHMSHFDSIVEYKKIEGRSYANQIWLLNSKGDTLDSRGNHYRVFVEDTVNIGDVLRIRFFLTRPYNSYDSELEVILPYRDEDLNEDYSNLFEIKRDTFPSLKNDGIPHPEIPKDVPINHYVEFGLEYESSGKKRIRGALIEYLYKYKGNVRIPDSLIKLERRLYFDEEVYVKEKSI